MQLSIVLGEFLGDLCALVVKSARFITENRRNQRIETRSLRKRPYLFEDGLVIEPLAWVVHHVFPEDRAVLADEEVCALGGFKLLILDAVGADGVHVSVAQQREIELELLMECLLRKGLVGADAEYLCVDFFEFFGVQTKLVQLRRSGGAEIEDVERE
jgi:hypothetical protein